MNTAYRGGLDPHMAALPARTRDLADGGVAGAAVVAQHLPAPIGGRLFAAAADAYATGMSDVLLITTGLVVGAAILIALFLPRRARAARSGTERPVEPRVA